MMTYNCEKYIDQSLKSVLRQQTTFPFEIIISDDASTDKTYQIITDIAENHDIIKLHKNKDNLGILKNFFKTLHRCKGEYVFDLAGDDWLSNPYALQTLVDELDQNPNYSFVDSGFDCYYERSGIIKSFINQNIVTSAKEDYPILTDLMMNTDFGLIPKVLSVYRKHRDSHSHQADSYLRVKLYFAEKYNYSKAEVKKIHQIHDDHMLHNASLISDKKSGCQHYKPLRRPILRNFVYFLCSQSHLARKFFTLFRKI